MTDITDQAVNLQRLQVSEEHLRLAVQSANLGTRFINAETWEFVPSRRLEELFGYHHVEDMPFDAAVKQINDVYHIFEPVKET